MTGGRKPAVAKPPTRKRWLGKLGGAGVFLFVAAMTAATYPDPTWKKWLAVAIMLFIAGVDLWQALKIRRALNEKPQGSET